MCAYMYIHVCVYKFIGVSGMIHKGLAIAVVSEATVDGKYLFPVQLSCTV